MRRSVEPNSLDLLFGTITILLVLEASRRTAGWILPVICIAFLAYAYYGSEIPASWELGHAGYSVERIIGQTYMGLEGIFGVPLDVAATYIILFTIYGAVLEYSGAGASSSTSASPPSGGRAAARAARPRWPASCSARCRARAPRPRSRSAPSRGRSCAAAGYPPDEGGGVLAASGIGAILSPPRSARPPSSSPSSSGLLPEVLVFAVVPTLLYYLGILLAIEADARRLGTRSTRDAAARAAAAALRLPLLSLF